MPRKRRRPAPKPQTQKAASQPKPAKQLLLPKAKWLVPVALVLVVLLGLWLRASDLGADPPPDLSWSFAPYTDEGLNTYSARNLVLYGT